VANRFLVDEAGDKEKTFPEVKKKKSSSTTSPGISLTGIDDVMVRFAKCCDPIPGDEIYGYISRGRGVTVHTAQCPVIRSMDTERLVDVAWNLKEKHTYPVQMRVVAHDYKGVLAEISAVISALDVNISRAEVDTTTSNQAICTFTLDVNDLKHFDKVVTEIKKLSRLLSVERIRK
jgi:GTP pyrophosphokinase